MANPVWKGTLTFGLLAMGVRLYSARQRHGPNMHQFQAGTSDRIRYRRVNERTGKEVQSREIVKGAEIAGTDRYVTLETQELESITPGRSSIMEVQSFVPAGSVDPLWYSAAYYMGPQDAAAAKPYRLLCSALQRADRLCVATVVMRAREHLVLIGPQQGVLAASTLYWPDEIRAPEDVMGPVAQADLSGRELELAGQLIDSMTEEWRPDRYEDEYERRLEELIAAKSEGRTISYEEERVAPEGTVVELTDALRQSLQARKGGQGKAGQAKGRAKATGNDQGKSKSKGLGKDPGKAGERSASRARSGGRAGAGRGAPQPRESSESGATKKELLEQASRLDVAGRSKMTKEELAEAVARARQSA